MPKGRGLRCAKSMNKKAYPQGISGTKPFKEVDLIKWKEARLKIDRAIRAYPEYTHRQIFESYTQNWPDEEKGRFAQWLKSYNSYKEASIMKQAQMQPAPTIKPSIQQTQMIESIRKKMRSRIFSLQKLLNQLIDQNLLGPNTESDQRTLFLGRALQRLTEEINSLRPKLAAARVKRCGHMFKRAGLNEIAGRLYFYAEEMKNPQQLYKVAQMEQEELTSILNMIKREMDYFNYGVHLRKMYKIMDRLSAAGRHSEAAEIEKVIQKDLGDLAGLSKKMSEIYTTLSQVPVNISERKIVNKPRITSSDSNVRTAAFGKVEEAYPSTSNCDGEDDEIKQNYVQWMTSDNKVFSPAAKVAKRLAPGFYQPITTMQGLFFNRIPLKSEDLITFPETSSDKVIGEIETFWEKEQTFRDNKLPFKRGILLYGPPGSGKSGTIQLVIDNLVKRGGIVLNFEDASTFRSAMEVFREIQPDTPTIVLMEDVDSILDRNCESEVINILDGLTGIEKVVFLATTNYPEKLGSRVMNRPSRFDKRIYVGSPNAETRGLYLKHKLGDDFPYVDKWVEDTDGMSIAHLKELIVATQILGDSYAEAINTLKQMAEKVDSSTWDQFGTGKVYKAFKQNQMTKNGK